MAAGAAVANGARKAEGPEEPVPVVEATALAAGAAVANGARKAEGPHSESSEPTEEAWSPGAMI